VTPAARAAAAIAILDRVLETGAAADRTLSNWGRENRYAGSKDRRAIAGHVYLALRTGAGETGRALLLSALAGQVSDAILGENAQPVGRIVYGEQTVEWETQIDTIRLTITDRTAGSVTVVEIPKSPVG